MEDKRYEYKKIAIHKISEEHYHGTIKPSKLQELGNEGWQLVTISSGECIFIREVTNPNPLAEVRPAVAWFAAKMEEELKKNDFKKSWYACDPRFLQDRMERKAACFEDNVRHLGMAINSPQVAVVKEAADIANYAMMVATHMYKAATGKEI
ncbi:hypothetical protein MARVELLAND_51 [Bacillus phage vB_BspM_MarvelLand]|nr:hypothetical protein MARVELLAND_51 [Bacillus phage vB_BspM_MarvelLand]